MPIRRVMSVPAHKRDQLILFSSETVPLDANGQVLADLWVELPHNDRFIRYICSGESLTARHLQTLAKHVSHNFFVHAVDLSSEQKKASATLEHSSHGSEAVTQEKDFAHERTFRGSPEEESSRRILGDISEKEIGMLTHFGKESADFLKKPIAIELKHIISELVAPSIAQINLEDSPINELTDQLVRVIAPEVENLRSYLKQIPQYLTMMDDSSAITAIATLFAIARGQSSRSVFKDLSYACLFMDISMSDFGDQAWKTYFLQPDALSEEQKNKIEGHPRRSSELVQKRFRNLPDIVNQLILGHHELFNGKGFPRHLRSEMLAPLVRILAFAVDVFEFMKSQHMQGEFCTLSEAVEYYVNEPVEPHMRRHNTVLCREIADFIRHP
ncbi:MAG: HD domain-containing phosphohydrolase [Bdellovibrionota bacterium]